MKSNLVVFTVFLLAGCQSKPNKLAFRNLYVEPIEGARRLSPTPHIINGREAVPHAYPYHVFLLLIGGGGWYCGGSLISRNYVITAAHCGQGAQTAHAILGAHNRNAFESSQVEIISQDIRVHPQYNSDILANDIAIIRLSQSAPVTDQIRPIAIPGDNSNSFAGRIGIATGWGATNNGEMSDVLRVVELNIISAQQCSQILSNIEPSKICTSGANGGGVCGGDSGGPLAVDGVLVGVTSFTVNACEPGAPNGFSRVSNALEWIHANTDV